VTFPHRRVWECSSGRRLLLAAAVVEVLMAVTLTTAGALLFVGVVILGIAVAASVAMMLLWRRWRSFRRLASVHVRGLVIEMSAVAWQWLWSRPRLDRRWRSLHRLRRELATSTAGAEHALSVARQTGTPLGDLESLCRRLRHGATAVDRSLRIAQRGTGPVIDSGAACHQAEDLVLAARHIQRATLALVSQDSDSATAGILRDVEQEVAAKRAGATLVRWPIDLPEPPEHVSAGAPR
jgi:hypothetical protein